MSTTTHTPAATRTSIVQAAAATFIVSCAFTALGTVASGASDEHGWLE